MVESKINVSSKKPVNKMTKVPLPYAYKLVHHLELIGMSHETFYKAIGENKSYFYNVIKRGRLISAYVAKKIEERLHIKFGSEDFNWEKGL